MKTWSSSGLGSRDAGAVVFAPSYNTDITTTEGLARTSDDLVCSYQLARRTATEYGGDLTQPFTVVGWSLGADLAMLGGLQGSGENTSTRCPGDVPRPDVVVGLSGCYYEFEGTPVTWFDDVSSWGNKSAHIYLTDGDRDDVCPAWQTERFATALRAAGYQVDVVQLHDANHFAPVFHDLRVGPVAGHHRRSRRRPSRQDHSRRHDRRRCKPHRGVISPIGQHSRRCQRTGDPHREARNLRCVMLAVIQEIARHAHHADIAAGPDRHGSGW